MTWDFIDYLTFAVALPFALYCGFFGGVSFMRRLWHMDIPYDQRVKLSGARARG